MSNIRLRLSNLIKGKGITQKQLSKETGLHESVISGIVRDSKDSISKKHLAVIMKALNISDFNEILEFIGE